MYIHISNLEFWDHTFYVLRDFCRMYRTRGFGSDRLFVSDGFMDSTRSGGLHGICCAEEIPTHLPTVQVFTLSTPLSHCIDASIDCYARRLVLPLLHPESLVRKVHQKYKLCSFVTPGIRKHKVTLTQVGQITI